MNTPSLSEFKARIVEPKPTPPLRVIKNITIRPTIAQWEALIAMTTAERTKIQPYVMELMAADFARRGLRWPL
jgi:hypothetical protein